jgi:hypothetical protein
MPLPAPAPRRHLHTRAITCEGFQRDDGLWDIEARIIDTKSYAYEEPIRGHREPGDEVHHMAVRLTLDQEMTVRDIEVDMPSTPYPACQGAAPSFKTLVGRRIGPGWRKAVNECVGGTLGCTHMRELLFPMATVAYQTMVGWTSDSDDTSARSATAAGGRPYFLDGCRAWASDGEVVVQLYPQFAVRRSGATADAVGAARGAKD